MADPIQLSPEEKQELDAKSSGNAPINPLKEFSKEDLVNLAVQDPSFNIGEEWNRNPDLHADPTATQKVADALHDVAQRGFKLADLPGAKKIAGNVWDVAKGFGKQAWNYASALTAPLTSAVGAVTGQGPEFQQALGENATRGVAENIAGSEQAVTSTAGMAARAVQKAGRGLGVSKPLDEYTPADKVRALFDAAGTAQQSAEIAKGHGGFLSPVGGEVVKELEQAGKPVRPEETATTAAGDPFSWWGFGKVFQGAQGLVPASAARLGAKATAVAGEGLAKAGGAAVSALGAPAELVGKATEAIAPVVKIAAPIAVVGKAAVEGQLPSIETLLAGGYALKNLEHIGEAARNFGAKAFRFGQEVAGKAPVTGAYSQGIRDVLQSAPGALTDVAKGGLFDIGTAAATSESPADTQGVGLGTAFGLLGGAKRMGGHVLSGQLIAPRDYGIAQPQPSSGQFKSLDALHNAAFSAAEPGVRARVNAIRQFVRGAAPGTDVFMTGNDEAATAAALQQAGVPADAAAHWASQNGAAITLTGADGKPRKVLLARNPDAAPHESFHAVQDVLGEEANQKIDDIVRQNYGDRWDTEGNSYAVRLNNNQPLGESTWREKILDLSGWGVNAAKEKIYQDIGNKMRADTPGAEPPAGAIESLARQEFGRLMDEALSRNPQLTPEEAQSQVWRDVLSPADATNTADRYLARELAAENFDAAFKRGQTTGLPGKLADIIGNVVSQLGGDPLAGRVSQIGQIAPKLGVVEAVRGAVPELPTVAPLKGAPKPAVAGPRPVPGTPAARVANAAEAQQAADAASDTPLTAGGTRSPRELLGQISEAIAQGTGIKINYLSAPDEPAAATTSNRTTRRAIIEVFRSMPAEARALWEKSFFPDRVITTKSGYQVQGWAPEVFAANAHKMAQALSKIGADGTALSPYPIDPATGSFTPDGWRQLYTDAQQFIQNQQTGHTGSGVPLVVPKEMEARGIFKPQVTGAGTPMEQRTADFINTLFNFKLPETPRIVKGKIPLNIAGQEVSEATLPGRVQVPVRPRGEFTGAEAERQGIEGRPIAEVNPVRNEIESAAQKAGVAMPSMIEAIQKLNLENIKEVAHAPEMPEFRGNTMTLTAGFQPKAPGVHEEPESIKMAAVKRTDNGKVFTGDTHGGAQLKAMGNEPVHPVTVKGFVTNAGEFLDRKQAYRRAMQQGQIDGTEFTPVPGSLESVSFDYARTHRGQAQPPAPTQAVEFLRTATDEQFRAATKDFKGRYGGGPTGWAFEVGAQARTPADLEALKSAATENKAAARALMNSGNLDDLQKAQPVILKAQLAREAYEAATGRTLDGQPTDASVGFIRRYADPSYNPPMGDISGQEPATSGQAQPKTEAEIFDKEYGRGSGLDRAVLINRYTQLKKEEQQMRYRGAKLPPEYQKALKKMEKVFSQLPPVQLTPEQQSRYDELKNKQAEGLRDEYGFSSGQQDEMEIMEKTLGIAPAEDFFKSYHAPPEMKLGAPEGLEKVGPSAYNSAWVMPKGDAYRVQGGRSKIYHSDSVNGFSEFFEGGKVPNVDEFQHQSGAMRVAVHDSLHQIGEYGGSVGISVSHTPTESQLGYVKKVLSQTRSEEGDLAVNRVYIDITDATGKVHASQSFDNLGKASIGKVVRFLRNPLPESSQTGQAQPPARNEDINKIAEDYLGKPLPASGYSALNPEAAKKIADYYESAKHDPSNEAVQKSYAALAKETESQYHAITDAGYTIEPWSGKGEPYANSDAMRADVERNKHLFFLPSSSASDASADNLMSRPSGVSFDGKSAPVNDIFRAVHDFFGHAKEGYQFGPRGEYNAWREHSGMYSDEAQGALAAETLAQNAWVNFGPHLRNEAGDVPARGEPGFVEATARPFAEQKNIVIPPEVRGQAQPKKENEKYPRLNEFWVSPKGEIIPAPEGHYAAGLEFLPENWQPQDENDPMASLYPDVYAKGYVRGVNGKDGIFIDGPRPNRDQQKALGDVSFEKQKPIHKEGRLGYVPRGNPAEYGYQPPEDFEGQAQPRRRDKFALLPKRRPSGWFMRQATAPQQETIEKPAVQLPGEGDEIISGNVGDSHDDLESRAYRDYKDTNGFKPGFITNTGRFVDRLEAERIADEAGQLKAPLDKKTQTGLHASDLKDFVQGQAQPKKGKDESKFLPSTPGGFTRAWILPTGKIAQIGGQWHHQWLSEDPEGVAAADKYKLDIPPFKGNDDPAAREAALRAGFVRVNLNRNNGLMTVEGRAADWNKRKPQVESLVQRNLDDIDRLRVSLMNPDLSQVLDSKTADLFKLDTDAEKLAAIPFLNEAPRAARTRATEAPAFRAPEEAPEAPLPPVYGKPEFAAFNSAGGYIGKYNKYGDAESAAGTGGSVKIMKTVQGQAQPAQFNDEGFDDALQSIRSGAAGGHTFNADGSLWNPPEHPVDIVSLASVNVPTKDLTREKMLAALGPYSALLNEPDIKAGVFSFDKGGQPMTSVDINAVVDQKHRENTVAFAKANDQVALWDAAKSAEVPTGGSGDTKLKSVDDIMSVLPNLLSGKPVNVGAITGKSQSKTNPRTAIKFFSGDETPEVKGTGFRGRPTLWDAAKFLSEPNAKLGKLGRESENDLNEHATALADEAAFALQRDPSAVGWYDDKITKMKNALEDFHPELKTDPNKFMVYKALMAINSNGQDIDTNLARSETLYRQWKKDGTIDTTGAFGGKNAPAINIGLRNLMDLIKAKGLSGAREFLDTDFTVGDLKKLGFAIPGELVSARVKGSVILGPKIGSFYGNLNGDFSSVTMDRWFMRTFNRISGTLTAPLRSPLPNQIQNVLNAFKGRRSDMGHDMAPIREELSAALAGLKSKTMEPEEMQDRNSALAKWMDDRFRAYTASRFADRSVQNVTVKNLYENLFGTENGEKPGSGSDRLWIRRVVSETQRQLREKGVNLTNADLQALLWYYEKELYAKLYPQTKRSTPTDYAKAAERFVAEQRGQQPGPEQPGPGAGVVVEPRAITE